MLHQPQFVLFLLAGTVIQVCTEPVLAWELFRDDFDAFNLGSTWQAHGAGVPEVSLGLSQPGLLTLHSDNIGNGARGIETITPIPLVGLSSVTFDVRLKPVNMGTAGTLSSAEFAVLGNTGNFIRAFASNNVGPDPHSVNDWADFYTDSFGNNATSGSFAHCSSVGGCAGFRRFVITVNQFGTTLEVRNEDESFHSFAVAVSDVKISNLGQDVRIALRQNTVDGADEVVGQFDSVRVTTFSSSSNPLLHAPYSQLANGHWQVRPQPGQTEFTLASYGNPTGLSTLQQYTAMLQSRGLGNGIDLGSSPRPWVQQEYQHIKSLGWSFTAWPGEADHQVDGGVGLDPAYDLILQILDTPSVRTPIHFGEWGYYFHELSSNAGYFASIYPGQDPSEYAHLMKAPGSTGYDTPPVDRVDAYNQLKSYYLNRNADWGGRLASVTGHSHYEAYAAEWGSPVVGLEIGENIRFTQSKFAFARGAARQWGVPWSTQVSPWFHGSLTTAGPLTGGPGTARGQEAGHSFSFYRRAWLHSWFAGAAKVTPEFSMGNLFEAASPPWDLTPLGELAVEVAEVMNGHDRGVPYTPVAIVLDHYAGYNAYQDKPWGVFAKTAGDQKTYDLFQHQLFPGTAQSNNPNVANPEAPYFVATPFGEMFDVVLSTATSSTLQAYPEILLVGDIIFDAPFVDSLDGALRSGSRLLLQQFHMQQLGAANFARLEAAGNVQLLSEWNNPATGRPAAISNSALQQLNHEHMPVAVTGDPVQYQVNRNAEGWVIELINNSGITKVPHLSAVIDPNATSTVALLPLVENLGAYDWLNGELFPAGASPWNVIIQPGDVCYIQIVIPNLAGDYNADGAVDAADYTVWQDTFGSMTDLRADGDLSGMIDASDFDVWKANFGATAFAHASAPVPEPAVGSLWACSAIAMLAFCRGRRHRHV